MRASKLLGIIILAAGIVLTAGYGVARASDSSSELAAGQTVNGVYITRAERVDLRGTVNGDVIAAGSTIVVDGTVNGNVYVAGSRVEIRGTVTGNVHAAGSEVIYGAQGAGSLFLAGNTVETGSQAKAKNLFAAGSDLSLGGELSGNAYAAGTQLRYASKTGGDVSLAASTITVTSSAAISGNLKYQSEQQAKVENDRSIAGSINRVQESQKSASERFLARLADTGYWLAANIAIAAALLWFAPRLFVPALASFQAQPANSYLKGVLFVIIVPIGLLLGLLSIIGIPLMLLLALIYIVVLVLSSTASAYYVGGWLLKRLQPERKLADSFAVRIGSASIGFFALAVLGLVPLVGAIITIMVFFLGVGIIVGRGFAPLGGPQGKDKVHSTKAVKA